MVSFQSVMVVLVLTDDGTISRWMLMVMVVLLVITYQGGRIKPAARQLRKEQDERQLHWELHQEGMGLETGGLDDNSV